MTAEFQILRASLEVQIKHHEAQLKHHEAQLKDYIKQVQHHQNELEELKMVHGNLQKMQANWSY
ncbi:MAG: hypothetical protein AAGA60_20995 [Cyanobacteria bacterium P01_E01_bin.42]